jgi:hypothetical protein
MGGGRDSGGEELASMMMLLDCLLAAWPRVRCGIDKKIRGITVFEYLHKGGRGEVCRNARSVAAKRGRVRYDYCGNGGRLTTARVWWACLVSLQRSLKVHAPRLPLMIGIWPGRLACAYQAFFVLPLCILLTTTIESRGVGTRHHCLHHLPDTLTTPIPASPRHHVHFSSTRHFGSLHLCRQPFCPQ